MNIEQYKNLCTYLEYNSLLKICAINKSNIKFDGHNVLYCDELENSSAVYKTISKDFFITKKLPSCKYTDILYWLKNELSLDHNNILNNFQIYMQNEKDYEWDLLKIYKQIYSYLKSLNQKLHTVKIKEGFVNEYEETLIWHNGIIEHRHYKYCVFYLEIKMNNEKFNKSICISSNITESNIKTLISNTICDLNRWMRYKFISIKCYQELLEKEIVCITSSDVSSSLIHESIDKDCFDEKVIDEYLSNHDITNKEEYHALFKVFKDEKLIIHN